MKEYYYSKLGNFLFLILGVIFIIFGLDVVYFNKFIAEENHPSEFVLWIIFIFAFLMLSSFFANLIKGKNIVLKSDSKGIKIYTGSVDSRISEIIISWDDIHEIKTVKIQSLFSIQGHIGSRTKALIFVCRKDVVKWPERVFMKNRIIFNRYDEYDEVIIDAWLNKTKQSIVNELNELGKKV